jgi:hypothetical protein
MGLRAVVAEAWGAGLRCVASPPGFGSPRWGWGTDEVRVGRGGGSQPRFGLKEHDGFAAARQG